MIKYLKIVPLTSTICIKMRLFCIKSDHLKGYEKEKQSCLCNKVKIS